MATDAAVFNMLLSEYIYIYTYIIDYIYINFDITWINSLQCVIIIVRDCLYKSNLNKVSRNSHIIIYIYIYTHYIYMYIYICTSICAMVNTLTWYMAYDHPMPGETPTSRWSQGI